MPVTTPKIDHHALADDDFDIADQIVRSATQQVLDALSADLGKDQTVCTSSALAVMLQSIALIMAQIDNDATAKMLTMLGIHLGGDDTNMPAFQNAMRHQQHRLMMAEMSMRARAGVGGHA